MPLTKTQKQEVLKDLEDKIAKQKAIVFVDFTGIKVKDLSDLRKKAKVSESNMRVAKKTLFDLALKKAGIEIDIKNMKGEIGAIFGLKDEISPARIAYQFSLENQNLKILGGYFENKYREAQDVIILAQIPSREVLLGKLVGSIQSPISGFVSVLSGNLRNLVYVLSQIKVAQ